MPKDPVSQVIMELSSGMRGLSKRVRKLEVMERKGGDNIYEVVGGEFLGNQIIRFDADLLPITYYDATEFGLESALDDAVDGDLVWIPPTTITVTSVTGYVIPAGVSLVGSDKYRTIIDADVDADILFDMTGASDGTSPTEVTKMTIDWDFSHTLSTTAKCVHLGESGQSVASHLIINMQSATAQTQTCEGLTNDAHSKTEGYALSVHDCEVYLEVDTTSTARAIYLDNDLATSDMVCYNLTGIAINNGAGNTYGIQAFGSSITRIIHLFDCIGYSEITETTGTLRESKGIFISYARALNCIAFAYNAMTGTDGEAIGINLWTVGWIFDCYAYAESAHATESGAQRTSGILIDSNSGTLIVRNCHAEGTCTGAAVAYGIRTVGSSPYHYAYNSKFIGKTADIGIGNSTGGDFQIYACQFESTYDDGFGGVLTYEWGDRDANHVQTITSDTTLDLEDYTVIVDASGGNVVVTLPAATSSEHKRYTIKRIDSSANTVTVDGNGAETIDDQATQTLAQYDAMRIECDGSEWWIT